MHRMYAGSVVSAIQLTLNYHSVPATNSTATPTLRRITLKDMVSSKPARYAKSCLSKMLLNFGCC